MSFVQNIIPRSPTKDRLDTKSANPVEYDRNGDRKHLSNNTNSDEDTTPSTPSKTDSDRPTSKHSLLETPSRRKGQTKATESSNTTPSKAAKLLGLSDDQYTPSKATRLLGSGLEGDEEFLKKRGGHRLSSGEFFHPSPSRRMARILEGAAAPFTKSRNSVDLSDLPEQRHDMNPNSSDNQPKANIAKVLRTPSLKYMDNNSIPPTPPDKDTIYRMSRSGSNNSRTHVQEVFKGDSAATATNNKPVYKGEKSSLKANLMPKPSIHSMSGVIESNSRYNSDKSSFKPHVSPSLVIPRSFLV